MGNPTTAPVLIPMELSEFWEKMRLIIREEIQQVETPKPVFKKFVFPNTALTSKPLLKMGEICRLLQVSRATIYQWIKKDMLIPYKIGSRVYFLLTDVQQLLSTSGSKK